MGRGGVAIAGRWRRKVRWTDYMSRQMTDRRRSGVVGCSPVKHAVAARKVEYPPCLHHPAYITLMLVEEGCVEGGYMTFIVPLLSLNRYVRTA